MNIFTFQNLELGNKCPFTMFEIIQQYGDWTHKSLKKEDERTYSLGWPLANQVPFSVPVKDALQYINDDMFSTPYTQNHTKLPCIFI